MTLGIAVVGASGRMGRRVLRGLFDDPSLHLCAALTRSTSPTLGMDAGLLAGGLPCGVPLTAVEQGFGDAEVVIDFSLPSGWQDRLQRLEGRGFVSGVTGLSRDDREALGRACETSAVLLASNFSTGVHVLGKSVAAAARALPTYDVEIVEVHHGRKKDAPSGTALFLAEQAAQARGVTLEQVAVYGRHGHTGTRPSGQIGIHAVRAGDVVGEHTVWIAGPGERLKLGHIAASRDTFALGAIRAAKWLNERGAGRYTMADVLGL